MQPNSPFPKIDREELPSNIEFKILREFGIYICTGPNQTVKDACKFVDEKHFDEYTESLMYDVLNSSTPESFEVGIRHKGELIICTFSDLKKMLFHN